MGLAEDPAEEICEWRRGASTPGEVHPAKQEQEEGSKGNYREGSF
jgi:hypothetical protein